MRFWTVSKLWQSEVSNFHDFVWFQYEHYDENCSFHIYSNCFPRKCGCIIKVQWIHCIVLDSEKCKDYTASRIFKIRPLVAEIFNIVWWVFYFEPPCRSEWIQWGDDFIVMWWSCALCWTLFSLQLNMTSMLRFSWVSMLNCWRNSGSWSELFRRFWKRTMLPRVDWHCSNKERCQVS